MTTWKDRFTQSAMNKGTLKIKPPSTPSRGQQVTPSTNTAQTHDVKAVNKNFDPGFTQTTAKTAVQSNPWDGSGYNKGDYYNKDLGGYTPYQADEIKRKALSGEQLMKPTEAKQALYNSFVQPKQNTQQPQFDMNALAELMKSNQPQFDMNTLTGQFTNMFTQLQQQNDARMQAFERMLKQQQEMMQNKQSYNQAQTINTGVAPTVVTPTSNTSQSENTPIGYQQQATMNDALYKYMQNLWGGGF